MEWYISLILVILVLVMLLLLKDVIINIILAIVLIVGIYWAIPQTRPYLEPTYQLLIKMIPAPCNIDTTPQPKNTI